MQLAGIFLTFSIAAVGTLYLTAAIVLMLRHVARAKQVIVMADRIYQRPISVIIPVKSPAKGLVRTVQSVIEQDYDCQIEILVIFQDADSPEHHVVQAMAQTSHLSGANSLRTLRLLQSSVQVGLNPKNSNLIQAVPEASHEWIYFCDADTRIESTFFLKAMKATEANSRKFATAISFHGNTSDLGSRLESVGVNFEMPSYFLITQLQKERSSMNGASMLMHRRLLAAAGGIELTANTLTDDIVLGKALQRAGGAAVLVPSILRVDLEHETLSSFWSRFKRWMMIIKFYDPSLFWLALTSWHWIHLFWIGLFFHLPIALNLSAFLLLYRMFTVWIFGWAIEREKSSPFVAMHMVLFDLLAPSIWVSAAFSREVTWVGQRLRISKDGTLTRISATDE